jgi:hypothetical protein
MPGASSARSCARKRSVWPNCRRTTTTASPNAAADERNFQRYLDRVAEMKAGITRKEADIAALKRELAKLGP